MRTRNKLPGLNVSGLNARSRGLVVIAAAIGAVAAPAVADYQLRGSGSGAGRTFGTSMFLANDFLRPFTRGSAQGDAIRTYTGGGNLFSNPATFGGALAGGDDLVFGPTPAGDYSVTNDTALTFNSVAVNRAAATATTTLLGGINVSNLGGVQVSTGRFVFDGGTSNLAGPGTNLATTGLLAGSTNGGNGSIVIQNGAVVNGVDALAGGASFAPVAPATTGVTVSSTGSLTVTGAGTRFQQLAGGPQDGFFGSTIGVGTVLVDQGASVTAFRAFGNDRGSFSVRNGSSITLNPLATPNPGTAASIARTQFSGVNSTNTNMTIEVSGGSSFVANDNTTGVDLFANASRSLFGIGQGSTTNMTVSGGSLFQSGIIGFGGAENTPSLITTQGGSVANLTVTGANSRVVATDSFSTSGTGRFGNNLLGTTTLNVLNGGSITAATFVAINGADRPEAVTTASSSTVLISGEGSKVVARNAAGSGQFYALFGDRTSSVVTVENGGLIDTNGFSIGSALVGGSNVVNVNAGGRIVADGIFGAGVGNDSTLNVTGGGDVELSDFLEVTSGGGLLNVNVGGASSTFSVGGQSVTGGFPPVGRSGEANFNVTNGGVMNFGNIFTGIANALPEDVDPDGTTFTVSGAGSRVNVNGFVTTPDPEDPEDDGVRGAFVSLGYGRSGIGTINVLNGGVFDIEQEVGDPDLSGALELARTNNSVGTVNVDGVGSTLNAGDTIFMAQINADAPAFANARATINVRNGGLLTATGNIQMGLGEGGVDNVITVNLGAVSDPTSADAASLIDIDGTVFVGGSGAAAAPIVGSPATVNINNGTLDSGGLLIYAGSNVNLNRGKIDAAVISARGGALTISPTAPRGSAVLIADEYQVDNNGFIDIGRNGGFSRLVDDVDPPVVDVDLEEIKTLILAARNGGAHNGINGIRSSVVASDTRLAIGYADIDVRNITSFLGVDFVPADAGIVFGTTLKGDTNLDGTVGFGDLVVLAQNYNLSANAEWFLGDFNYNDGVGFDDLVALAQNYNASFLNGTFVGGDASSFGADWALAQSLVPEPTTLGMIAAAGTLGLRRRRRA